MTMTNEQIAAAANDLLGELGRTVLSTDDAMSVLLVALFSLSRTLGMSDDSLPGLVSDAAKLFAKRSAEAHVQ